MFRHVLSRRWLLLLPPFCLLLLLAIASPFGGRASQRGRVPQPRNNSSEPTGLQIRLSEGRPEAERQPSTPAPAAPLAEAATQAVLRRLPPLKVEDGDEQEFAFRERSLPPPRTGKTIAEAFPPPGGDDAPAASATGPLEVTRFAPEGEVPLAPHLSVTFSQPMVAVTSHADLAASVPVKLTPQPPGRWRWVGTRTLLFEPEGRFPMATDFTVEVPAGARSAVGGTLGAARRWSFATPPLQVKASAPQGSPHRRDPLLFIEFDQRIDPTEVLKHVRLRAGGSTWPLRLASSEEVAADEPTRRLAEAAGKDRWLALRADRLLPAETIFTVAVGEGAPSAEGPRATTREQAFTFGTYGPLRIAKSQCGYQGQCPPFAPWQIEFSNPLDAARFESGQLRVEPELPGLKTAVYGQMLMISGAARGRTTYRVTLDRAIRDQFGQELGRDEVVTFDLGSAPPMLAGPGNGMVVLDPAGPPRYSVYSVNQPQLKVSLYSVGPEHWRAYALSLRSDSPDTPPGRLVKSETIEVAARPDEMVETQIDLAPHLRDGSGQLIVVVEPTVQPPRQRHLVRNWIQVTGIGLDFFVDRAEIVTWATALKDGRPLEGAQVAVLPLAQAGEWREAATTPTGADGLARIALPPDSRPKILVARRGSDVAIFPEDYYGREGAESQWRRRNASDALRWHVFDDRGMYRPGEEVRVKGWVRRIGGGKDGDVGPLGGVASSVSYALKDSRDNEILTGTLPLSALGGFDAALKLPPTMNLGPASLELQAQGSGALSDGREHEHEFQVQEFRRPEYEVKTAASEGPHFVRGRADVTVTAAYYAGGGLPDAQVNWRVTTRMTNYTPPNRGDFIFGKWVPWWGYRHYPESERVETFAGRTDGAGKHHLGIDFLSADPPRPANVIAEASVTDVNRQTWSGSSQLLVHPADLYIGLRGARLFVPRGEPLVIQSIVTDLDGRAIAGREARVRAVRLDWAQEREADPQECVVKSGAGPVECRFETKEGGIYRLVATVKDDRGRENQTEINLWVAGGKQPPLREVAQEKVELIPDRKEYQDGETAEVLVNPPFYPAEGVLTLRRSGLVETARFTVDGPSHILKVPIKDAYVPNLHVQVDLVGAATRTDEEGKPNQTLPKRPAFASGTLNLSVPPLKRKLAVRATPRDQALEPGGETTVEVEVRDAAGQPVAGGELAVVVVDEAILALTGYQLADPLETFYAQRNPDVLDYHLRERILLNRPGDLAKGKTAGLGGGRGGELALMSRSDAMAAASPAPMMAETVQVAQGAQEAEREQIRLRADFNALATFAPAVPTDARGRATVKVKLPDNLTRYRVMTVAVAGGRQFGAAESAITARLPLMVRPAAPRFLNFGDRFELPVIIQNQTDQPLSVDVAARAANAELTDGAGRSVTVPANDRVEVRFPASAARPGTARFQFGAMAGRWSDAAEVSLPVWTPATTEAFAAYGEVDAGAIAQPVKAPTDAMRQFGGLEVTTSSTQLQALTDAVLYLTNYPFECAEQIASRVLAVAALRDVLAAFEAKGLPPPDQLVAAVARDIERLRGLQNEDGSFGFWRRGGEPWPYLGIHVAHALQRAREKKFEVPAEMLARSHGYLREIERHIPANYGLDARRALVAYALNVRARMGDRDAARARGLIAEAKLENLSLEAVGWLLPVLAGDPDSRAEVASIRRHLGNRVEETAAGAHFTTAYRDGGHLLLNSDRRADAVILEALIASEPGSDLIPKIVRGLLGHRRAGRWENTQENAFVLLALDRYFAVYEKETPNFVVRAWLGEAFAGEHAFRGRATERHHVSVPMRYLAARPGAPNLILSKEGPGRLYYRIGMQYAPASLQLKPADHGFTVERVYQAVDRPEDVRRDPDGTWRIRAGAQVRVRLTMVTPARRYHVALVDPLPAGLEAMNPALAVTGSVPRGPREPRESRAYGWWWLGPWFEHQNLRDERVEAFASLLWEGVHTYAYVARATTPGAFVVPPPKAEEMYHPETFGRGATDRVIIE